LPCIRHHIHSLDIKAYYLIGSTFDTGVLLPDLFPSLRRVAFSGVPADIQFVTSFPRVTSLCILGSPWISAPVDCTTHLELTDLDIAGTWYQSELLIWLSCTRTYHQGSLCSACLLYQFGKDQQLIADLLKASPRLDYLKLSVAQGIGTRHEGEFDGCT
jgi:hypothetical protein